MNTLQRVAMPLFMASLAVSQMGFADDMKPNGCKGVSLCGTYPDLDCWGMEFDIGFILEQMRVSGTDFGYLEESAVYNGLPQVARLLRPEFKLSWGLDATAAYFTDRDEWLVRLHFDWLQSAGTKKVAPTGIQSIIPTGIWDANLIAGQPSVTYASVHAKLSINYFNLDLEVVRGGYIGQCFAIEPHAGLKNAWIYYNGKTKFNGNSAGSYSIERYQKNNFWGIGPSFGVDTKWHLAEQITAFLDSQMAVLFGSSHSKDTTGYLPNMTTYSTYCSERVNVMSPAVRALLGFQYDKDICNGKQHVKLRIAMDTTNYWGQFQQIQVVNESDFPKFKSKENNNFGMVGLLVDFGWNF